MATDPDAKTMPVTEPASPRDWRLIALNGGAGFPVAFALLYYVMPAGWLSSAPVSAFGAAVMSVLIATIVAVMRIHSLRVHNLHMRVALDNMSQGPPTDR